MDIKELEWRDWLITPDAVVVGVAYRDKYGPLGKISVVGGNLVKRNSSGQQTLCIQTWVMSCRAFSRFIEYEILRWVFDHHDVEGVEFEFLSTPRNGPMQSFLQQILEMQPTSHCPLSRSNLCASALLPFIP